MICTGEDRRHRRDSILAYSIISRGKGEEHEQILKRISKSAENLNSSTLSTADLGYLLNAKGQSSVRPTFKCDLLGLKINGTSLELWSCLAKAIYNFQFSGYNFESKENNQVR